MIHRGISVSLQKVLPKFIPRIEAEVDALLDCKLRVYVQTSYFTYFTYHTFLKDLVLRVRLKGDGKAPDTDRHDLFLRLALGSLF